MAASASELEVSLALEKLIDCSIVARGLTGDFYSAAPHLGDLVPRIRLLTSRYGELRGVEAVVLAVIPPALLTQSLDLARATQVVNAAIASRPEISRMVMS